jgi:hypothetical protein
MRVEAHGTIYCPYCGQEVVLDSSYCQHVQYIYGWSSVDQNGYVYAKSVFFSSILKTKLTGRAYSTIFSQLSPVEREIFLDGRFEPMDSIAIKARYCGDKADITFCVNWGVGYSGYYIGFSEEPD